MRTFGLALPGAFVLAAALAARPSVASPPPAAPCDAAATPCSATASSSASSTPPAPSGRGAPPAAAMEHYRRGLALYDAGDHTAALAHFERAYTLSRNYQLLFNIGQIQYAHGRLARARAALERYLGEGGSRIPLERREAVRRQLAELSLATGVLTLHLDGAPVELEVQGLSLATSAAELPVIVEPGVVRVVARRASVGSVERRVSVAAGGTEHLSLAFALRASRAEPPGAPSAEPVAAFPTQTVIWTAAGALGALAISGAIATRVTSSRYDELRRNPADGGAERYRQRLDQQRDRVETLALATDVLGVAALAAAGVGLFISLGEPDGSPAEQGGESNEAAPRVALRPGQVELSVEF